MKPLVDIPQSRDFPSALRSQLRAIDPVAEVVYVGDGRWLLGRVVWSSERNRKGTRLLRWEHTMKVDPDPDNLRVGRLAQQGFGTIAEYRIQGEPDARIVHDFRLRDWLYLNDPEGTFKDRLADSCGDTAAAAHEAKVLDWVDSVSPDAYRHAFRKPVSVLQS
jgi:hypothetical protein